MFSQDYKKVLSKANCECLKNVDISNKTYDQRITNFGVCAFKSSQPFLKEIKRDYGIDLISDIGNQEKMKDFGVQIGMLTMSECSETFLNLMKEDEALENNIADSKEYLISGTVTKIEKGNFLIFHLVGDSKILNKFYWVTNIESNLDLATEYGKLLNKKVNLSYYPTEIFDVNINNYKNVNIISTLKTD